MRVISPSNPPRQNTICPPAQTHILIFPFSAGKQCRCRAEPLVGFRLKRVLSNVFDYWTKTICKQRQRLSLRPSLCSIVNVSINNNHSFRPSVSNQMHCLFLSDPPPPPPSNLSYSGPPVFFSFCCAWARITNRAA